MSKPNRQITNAEIVHLAVELAPTCSLNAACKKILHSNNTGKLYQAFALERAEVPRFNSKNKGPQPLKSLTLIAKRSGERGVVVLCPIRVLSYAAGRRIRVGERFSCTAKNGYVEVRLLPSEMEVTP